MENGYELRPNVRGGAETTESQVRTSRHTFTGEAWGVDLFSRVHGRAGRTSKWAAYRDGESWCCETHHKEGDCLAVKMCAEHRMTRCTFGTTECRNNHHHRCLDHKMPTCEHCRRHAEPKARTVLSEN